jgi:hypothetical protein
MLGAGFAGLEPYQDSFRQGWTDGDNAVDGVDSLTQMGE